MVTYHSLSKDAKEDFGHLPNFFLDFMMTFVELGVIMSVTCISVLQGDSVKTQNHERTLLSLTEKKNHDRYPCLLKVFVLLDLIFHY